MNQKRMSVRALEQLVSGMPDKNMKIALLAKGSFPIAALSQPSGAFEASTYTLKLSPNSTLFYLEPANKDALVNSYYEICQVLSNPHREKFTTMELDLHYASWDFDSGQKIMITPYDIRIIQDGTKNQRSEMISIAVQADLLHVPCQYVK